MGTWSTPRPGRFTPGNDPVPVVQEAVSAPGPISTGAEEKIRHLKETVRELQDSNINV